MKNLIILLAFFTLISCSFDPAIRFGNPIKVTKGIYKDCEGVITGEITGIRRTVYEVTLNCSVYNALREIDTILPSDMFVVIGHQLITKDNE